MCKKRLDLLLKTDKKEKICMENNTNRRICKSKFQLRKYIIYALKDLA